MNTTGEIITLAVDECVDLALSKSSSKIGVQLNLIYMFIIKGNQLLLLYHIY